MTVFLDQLINGLQLGLVYALIALGYTMVYGIIRLINFAHGEIFMIGAYLGFFSFSAWGLPFWAAFLIAMGGAAVAGTLTERLAYRPLRKRGAPRIAALITAIGVSLFLQYFLSLRFAFGPNFRTVERPFATLRWSLGPLSVTNIQVLIFGAVVLMLLLLQVVVYRTKIGKAMRAVSHDIDAARLMGVPVDGIIMATFALGSALAGAGGILFITAYGQIWPFIGVMPGLKAFTAAVLGGIGNIRGAVLGALIMGQVEVLSAAYISSSFRDAIAFSILILVLLLRPTGLLGSLTPEKV